MIILTFFAFLAGIVTVLSPCILPLMPIILSSSGSGSRHKPLGVVVGFVASFTIFTLFLTFIVNLLGIPADSLRTFSIFVLVIFGLSSLVPKFQKKVEIFFGKIASLVPANPTRSGFVGGVVIGLSLGLLWTPCVGPILASVIALALTGSVNSTALLITFAYALGTAIPMFGIMSLGSLALKKIPWLAANTIKIQKAFGVVMILTALAISQNLDRRFQIFILNAFPKYGTGLTSLENNPLVINELNKIKLTQNLGPNAPEFVTGVNWLNSPPLTLSQLKGKVVLVDFWTYTCINCIRTLPHLNSWYDKYKDSGFVIVGVHTPEFEFEKNTANVTQAISDFGIKYPVVQDNDYTIWDSYQNRYWPAEYLIDANGQIRHTHFGEGEYDQTEMFIQKLLKEAGASAETPLDQKPDNTPRVLISPESYLGSARSQQNFDLTGVWQTEVDNLISGENATLSYHFFASKVYLVLAPPDNQKSLINVYIDGEYSNQITVDIDKLYTLYDKPGSPEVHTIKLEFLTPGTKAFAFTFG